jgi:uncharacterized protein YciI
MMDKAALEAEIQALIPPDMTTVYLGLLMRGPAWTPEVTEATERLQIAHLTHIRQMREAGQVIMVGPCTDGGQLRGAYILRVSSLEEARALADADPAVKAGRLVVELHPWLVSESTLPSKGKVA